MGREILEFAPTNWRDPHLKINTQAQFYISFAPSFSIYYAWYQVDIPTILLVVEVGSTTRVTCIKNEAK